MSTPAKLRLINDLKRFYNRDEVSNLYAQPRSDNLLIWEAVIFGPEETIWDGGCFKLILEFNEEYPVKPPDVRFCTTIFHPNVYNDGKICLDILNNQWSSIFDVRSILESIQSLLDNPNPSSPANAEAARLFVENKKENYRLIIAPTSNNIYLPEHYLESMKEDFDPEYYRINVLGQFGNYSSGLVVKNFTDDNIKNLQYNDTLPLHLTCDFNVDPMCWCLAHKDDKNIYFFDELTIENTTTQQAIDEFIRRYPNHKGDLIINGDASGDNRTAQSEFTNYMIIKRALESHGYSPKFQLRN